MRVGDFDERFLAGEQRGKIVSGDGGHTVEIDNTLESLREYLE